MIFSDVHPWRDWDTGKVEAHAATRPEAAFAIHGVSLTRCCLERLTQKYRSTSYQDVDRNVRRRFILPLLEQDGHLSLFLQPISDALRFSRAVQLIFSREKETRSPRRDVNLVGSECRFRVFLFDRPCKNPKCQPLQI